MADNYGGGSQRKRRKKILKDFEIHEISLVDRPANPKASVVLTKRAADADMAKANLLTNAVDGHVHSIGTTNYDGGERIAGETSYTAGHTHPWITTDAGIVIGEAMGHTHAVDVVGKREFSSKERQSAADSGAAMPDGSYPIKTAKDLANAVSAFGRAKDKGAVARHIKRRAKALGLTDKLPTEGALADLLGKAADDNDSADDGATMADDAKAADNKATETLTQERDEALAKSARFEAIVGLTPQERVHFDGLAAAQQDAFLKQSKAQRLSEIAKAADANPVVYTATDGSEFRKSDDPRLVTLAKRNDEQAKELAKAEQARVDAEFIKRARDELPDLPGDEAVRAAILKAVEQGIKDDGIRKKAVEVLKAHNAAFAGIAKTIGTKHGEDSPQARLDVLAKAYANTNKVSVEKAMDAVLQTKDGINLYNQLIDAAG